MRANFLFTAGLMLLLLELFACQTRPKRDVTMRNERLREKARQSSGASPKRAPEAKADKGRSAKVQLADIEKEGSFAVVKLKAKDDPVYKKSKDYEGYSLDLVLQRLDIPDGEDEDIDIIFHCVDGYAPTMPLSLVKEKRGLVAVRDLEASPGENWVAFPHGKKDITPAPYYLVWEDVSAKDLRYKWPYNLKAIGVVNYRKIFGDAVPKDPKMRPEFATFKTHCLQCHSVNLAGGRHGPELNTPRNILEYWTEKDFRAFAKNPADYRAKSSMPANPHLKDEELDQIVAYLRYMKQHKRRD